MTEMIFIIAMIALLVAFIIGIAFPAVPTAIYSIWEVFCGYLAKASGFIWIIFPKDLTFYCISFVFAVTVLLYGIKLFFFIYTKIRG